MARLTRMLICAALLVCTACQAPLSIPAGRSALRVRFDADPKSGYREPSSDAYSSDTGPPNVGAFERVNYRTLDDLVVWIEPADDSQRPLPPEVVIDVGHDLVTFANLTISGVGGTLRIRVGQLPETVYSVSPGNEFHLGPLEPNSEAVWRFAREGIVEILTERRMDPIVSVYVAPTPWVRRADSDETVAFNDLPPGACRVSCWHARLPGESTEIELAVDRAASIRLRVGVNSLPKIP